MTTATSSSQQGMAGGGRPMDAAVERLQDLQRSDGGWPYEPGQATSFSEPTCWTLMALHSLGLLTGATASSGCSFLKSLQLPDGGFCTGTINREANWSTALSVWCLSILNQEQAAAKSGERWLLEFTGYHWQKPKNSPLGHDTSIQGWPWLRECHSWVEPTSYAIHALRSRGITQHPRLSEARRMIADRCLPGGGWNYGNTMVLGNELRPFPSTTATALIALHGDKQRFEQTVARSLAYLDDTLPRLRTPWALGWTRLALRCLATESAVEAEPEGLDEQIAGCLVQQLKPGARLRVHELAISLLATCPFRRLPFIVAVEENAKKVDAV